MALTRDGVRLKVTHILVDQLGIRSDEVTSDADVEKDLGADSLDCMEIAMACEEEFGVPIADEEIEALKTVGQYVEFIVGKLPRKGAA